MKSSFSLKIAKIGANFLVSLLKDYCEKIEILGSIRREKEFVNDIEILVIPKFGEVTKSVNKGVFKYIDHEETNTENLLFGYLEILGKTKQIEFIKNGPKMKQFMFPFRYNENHIIQVDFFTAVFNTWGLQKMIRTGSKDYSKDFMIQLKKRGEYKSENGFLWDINTGKLIKVPTEYKLFEIVGFPFKDPIDRDKGVF